MEQKNIYIIKDLYSHIPGKCSQECWKRHHSYLQNIHPRLLFTLQFNNLNDQFDIANITIEMSDVGCCDLIFDLLANAMSYLDLSSSIAQKDFFFK